VCWPAPPRWAAADTAGRRRCVPGPVRQVKAGLAELSGVQLPPFIVPVMHGAAACLPPRKVLPLRPAPPCLFACGCCMAAEGNSQVLFDYLTGSEEVLESTRRWPAWQQRLVPKIVLALTGRWLGTGLPPNPNSDSAAAEASGAATGGNATETASGAGKIQDIGGKRARSGPPGIGAKRVRRAAAMQD
jgi:hypothetical protein